MLDAMPFDGALLAKGNERPQGKVIWELRGWHLDLYKWLTEENTSESLIHSSSL